ncbi:sigma-70 family RNA polymerase sigma factor [Reichenbachiella sp. MALMAid0571]|uniref:RNA polymerase sigma factor n=1 Tax=Reichenbachiella sp. MALMAid0571 TaxID=3143939 RepID=UPI0032E02DD0
MDDFLTIQSIQNRDRQVYEALFHNHYHQLVRFAEGMIFDPDLAQDLVQSLFIHLWENAANINIKSSLKAYLFMAVKNRCLNCLKELQIRDKNELLYLEGMLNSDSSEDIDPQLLDRLNFSLAQLPDKMVEIVKLKYLENRKLRDIAVQLNISENTVKTQLLRSKRKLRKLLQVAPALIMVIKEVFRNI